MRNLLVIPARGGSKGVPLKNIKKLNGYPLVYYAIKAALECSDLFEHVIVSTDSNKIKKVSEGLGVEVPFLRPKEISTDESDSKELILHAVEYFEKIEKEKYDWVLMLQPTNPLVVSGDIRNCIKMTQDLKNKAETIVSVVKVSSSLPYNLYKSEKSNRLIKFNEQTERKRRQEYTDEIYKTNGSIYMVSRDYIVQNNSLFSDDMFYYEVPKSRFVDIDDEEDFMIASKLLDLKL